MANGKYSIKDFVYGGKYHDYLWNKKYNPNATIANCLANCTTETIGFTYIHNLPYPVSYIASAANWHKVLINGWTKADYGSRQLKVGDIVQWVAHCHVATVIRFEDGVPILGCSWYTGEHGKSVIDIDGEKDYDPRDQFNSLQEVSDFMSTKYPYRFYHEVPVDDESEMVGGAPEHILVAPEVIKPVPEDKSVDQIYVYTDTQNIRDNDNNIVGVAQHGFYNVYAQKKSNGYIWYEIADNRYIAGVSGRVEFIPAYSDKVLELEAEIMRLNEEVERCHAKLKEIQKISEFEE